MRLALIAILLLASLIAPSCGEEPGVAPRTTSRAAHNPDRAPGSRAMGETSTERSRPHLTGRFIGIGGPIPGQLSVRLLFRPARGLGAVRGEPIEAGSSTPRRLIELPIGTAGTLEVLREGGRAIPGFRPPRELLATRSIPALEAGTSLDLGAVGLEIEPVFASGRVVDRAGNPVEGAQVTVRPARIDLERGRVVTTDADGRFLLCAAPIPGADYLIEAQAELRTSETYRLREPTSDIRLELGERGSLRMLVGFPAGWSMRYLDLKLEEVDPPAGRPRWLRLRPDEEGRVERPVPEGRWRLRGTLAGLEALEPREITLTGSAGSDLGALQLGASWSVRSLTLSWPDDLDQIPRHRVVVDARDPAAPEERVLREFPLAGEGPEPRRLALPATWAAAVRLDAIGWIDERQAFDGDVVVTPRRASPVILILDPPLPELGADIRWSLRPTPGALSGPSPFGALPRWPAGMTKPETILGGGAREARLPFAPGRSGSWALVLLDPASNAEESAPRHVFEVAAAAGTEPRRQVLRIPSGTWTR